MIARPDGLKVSRTKRVCFCVRSSESYAVSSDFVWARFLNGDKSTRLIDSEVEIASSGDRYGKGCKCSNLEKSHN